MLLASGALLVGCAGGAPALELGQAAPLEAQDPLGVELTVLSVTESTLDEAGLTGLMGTAIDGVPWLVGYRIDLTSGTREDFSWEAVPDLGAAAWTADAGRAGDVAASSVSGGGAQDLPCPEAGLEREDDSIGFYCRVFLLPDDAAVEAVRLADVATWTAGSR